MCDVPQNDILFSTPGDYRIEVLGKVDPDIWDYFEGGIDEVKEDKNGRVTTSIRVHVLDQAELSGIINLLYDERLVLLCVKIARTDEEK